MRKALALLVVLVLMPLVLAPPAAQAQGQPRVVTVRDAETEALIRAIAHPLFRGAGLDPASIRITLLQAPAINAFATTGNRLFVNTGVIQHTESPAELAGVLAHETGHLVGGHPARLPEELRAAMIRQAVAMLLGGAAAVAGGGSDGAAAGIGIAMAGQNLAVRELLAYTRAQEQAADQAAIGLLVRAGWSPLGFARLLERLLEAENLQVSGQDPYVRTHPLSRDRLDFVLEEARRLGGGDRPVPAGLAARYAMVRAKLDGFLDPPATTLRRYAANDASAPARYARAIALHRSGREAEGLALIEGLVRQSPRDPYLLELEGQVLFEGGRVRDSLIPYAAVARIAANEPLIRAAYGRALIEAGDRESLARAVRELEAAVARDREAAFAWRLLAVARGRSGDLAGADLALAEEAMLLNDFATAHMLASRAEPRLPRGPARLRATDIQEASRRDHLTPEQRAAEQARRREERR